MSLRFLRRFPRPIPHSGCASDEAGATLIESLLAFSIFAAAAVGIFPLIAQVRSTNKGTDVRQLCVSTVKSKLAEYQAGRPIDWSAFTGTGSDSDSQDLKELTMVSASSTTSGGAMSSGFMYAKLRYNQLLDGTSFVACEGESRAALHGGTSSTTVLGMRECVGSNASWEDVASSSRRDALWTANCASNAVDEYVNREIPGFKLYVKLERFTPWELATQPSGSGDRRFHATCPNSNSGTGFTTGVTGSASRTYTRPLYDFTAAGDQIRVTVTGVMDAGSVLPASATQFAGIPLADRNRLTCQASSLVAPPPQDFRFLLTSSDIRGAGPSVVEALEALGDGDSGTWPQNRQVLRKIATGSVISLDAPDSGFSAFRGMVIHPLNLSVYVLRGSSVTRYTHCGGVPLECSVNGTSTNGLEDNGTGGAANVQNVTLSTGSSLQFDALLARFDPSVLSTSAATALYGWRRGGCELWKFTPGGSGTWTTGTSPVDESGVFGLFGTAGCTGLTLGQSVRGLFMDPAGTTAFYLRDAQIGGMSSDADYYGVYSAHDSVGLHRYSLIKGGDVRAVSK